MLLKTRDLRKNIAFIKPEVSAHRDIKVMLEEIKNYISSEECKHNIILDLTELNFLNCIRIGVLAATYHFVQFLGGKIYIIVRDRQTKRFIELLSLSNVVVIYNQHQIAIDNIA